MLLCSATTIFFPSTGHRRPITTGHLRLVRCLTILNKHKEPRWREEEVAGAGESAARDLVDVPLQLAEEHKPESKARLTRDRVTFNNQLVRLKGNLGISQAFSLLFCPEIIQ